MARVEINLSGPEYAEHLAANLTDLEFELMLRARIKRILDATHAARENLGEHHTSVRFEYSVADKSTWRVSLGETYSLSASSEGEVFTCSVSDAIQIMDAKKNNKLSLLLSAPLAAE